MSTNQVRDENLDHPAVVLYRQTFRLCPNWGFRKDIAATVQDLKLFGEILREWKKHKWNPLKVNWMLSEYERRNH